LFRVDGEHAEAVLNKRFDRGASGDLDGNGHLGGIATRSMPELVHESGKSLSTMGRAIALKLTPFTVEQRNAMRFRSPVDAHKITEDRYLLHSDNPRRLWFSCFFRVGMEDFCLGRGIDHHGLLSESVEELATAFSVPSIEAKCEFIDVIVEMFVADRALMSS
jgi:hypothetical protein